MTSLHHILNRILIVGATLPLLLGAGSISAAPALDGSIGSEGWIHLVESIHAEPVAGGLPSSSDFVGEVSAQHRWDNVGGVDVDLGSPRGDIQNLFVQWDATHLYLGVEGPTVPFRDWAPGGEEGDLYIALDTRGGTANNLSDSLTADDGHKTLHNVNDPQAIDFFGWQPTYIVGVDWVDNTDFTAGDGFANLEATGSHTVMAGEGHGVNNGGFEWAAGFDAGQSRGVFEFALLWTDLGLSGPPTDEELRLAAYTTADFDFFDGYDSGPGIGQSDTGPYEEVGDHPGDLDSGLHGDDNPQIAGTHDASDGLLGDTGNDDLSLSGSFPGSNYVNPTNGINNYAATPGPSDEIDTIQEYMVINIVPEPGTVTLLLIATGMLIARKRWIR